MNLKRHANSFTLVEMLVSIAVFSLLMLLLLAIIGGAIQLWRQQSAKEQSFREARAALNTLSRDMSDALISTNPAWFYLNTNIAGTTQLAFLTTLPSTAQATNLDNGDICAVGYSLEWGASDTSSTQQSMSLYRYVSFSNPTYSNNLLNTNNSIQSIFVNPDGINTVRELVARNVCQFSVDTYTNDDTGTPWPSDQGFLSNMMLNVVVTTLNDRAAAQMTTETQWQNTNSALIQQNEESFVLRIRPQGP